MITFGYITLLSNSKYTIILLVIPTFMDTIMAYP